MPSSLQRLLPFILAVAFLIGFVQLGLVRFAFDKLCFPQNLLTCC